MNRLLISGNKHELRVQTRAFCSQVSFLRLQALKGDREKETDRQVNQAVENMARVIKRNSGILRKSKRVEM